MRAMTGTTNSEIWRPPQKKHIHRRQRATLPPLPPPRKLHKFLGHGFWSAPPRRQATSPVLLAGRWKLRSPLELALALASHDLGFVIVTVTVRAYWRRGPPPHSMLPSEVPPIVCLIAHTQFTFSHSPYAPLPASVVQLCKSRVPLCLP